MKLSWQKCKLAREMFWGIIWGNVWKYLGNIRWETYRDTHAGL